MNSRTPSTKYRNIKPAIKGLMLRRTKEPTKATENTEYTMHLRVVPRKTFNRDSRSYWAYSRMIEVPIQSAASMFVNDTVVVTSTY